MVGSPYMPETPNTPDIGGYSGPAKTPGAPGTPNPKNVPGAGGAHGAGVAPSEVDQTRLCPTCRMPISVLATRCRHCGQEVARARKPSETYTVKDLGGAEAQIYEAPGSVTQALEAFRAEVAGNKREEKKKKGLFQILGHEEAKEKPHKKEEEGLPELNQASLDLAASLLDSPMPGKSASYHKPPKAEAPKDVTKILLIVSGVVVALILLVVFVQSQMGGGPEPPPLPPPEIPITSTAPPPAPSGAAPGPAVPTATAPVAIATGDDAPLKILEAGGDPNAALRAAREANLRNNTASTKKVLDEVRTKVIAHITQLIEVIPWNRDTLDKASELVVEATILDPDPSIVELRKKVEHEVAVFKMILISLNKDTKKATFKLHDPEYAKTDESVSEGDYLMGRFLVKQIGVQSVLLEDTAIKSPNGKRIIRAELLSQVVGE